MYVWTRCLVGAAVGVLLGGPVLGQTDGDSGYFWVSAPGAARGDKAEEDASPKAMDATREIPAESPHSPAGQWRSPTANKSVEERASVPATAPKNGLKPLPPIRLPEDPGYRPPAPQTAPAPAVGDRTRTEAVPPWGPVQEKLSPALGNVPVCDRTPCDWCGDRNCTGTCGPARRTRACPFANDPDDETEKPWRLFDWPLLTSRGFNIRGWVDQGVTIPAKFPSDRFNGPVTFNDRADEYQLNQLYFIAERETSTEGQGFDVGGRVDLLYGTDSRFTVANGLDTTWNGGHRFYGLAMPQLYADLALNDWTVRLGHFYTIIGYESVMAVDNFFYSHAYSRQYGEPFTFTGMLAKWQFNDAISFSAGFHRGWNQWEDNNDRLGFLGGVTWANEESGTSIAFAITASNEQVNLTSSLTMYSVVIQQRLAERWRYVLEHDGAHETNALLPNGSVATAEWFGLTNYLFFDVNPQWSLGLRHEWFADNQGARVVGLGAPRGFDFPPAGEVFPAYWNEVSIGAHYTPHRNVLLRCEGRWDWADPVGTSNLFPFTDQTRRSQFLFATDLIVQF